ncbi:aldo/keto reductase [Mycena maculata]|uniref:Aldo/keto reductase n=1 Tax=Mycena maculata TaxID=230809 RepID=A0AAD7H8H0_9AGAR|nr:aldo/keto reductase [Mycena maculata]
MVQQTTKLGGTASNVTVGRVAFKWIPTPAPEEQCFEAVKAGIDALPAGTKGFLNSGEFYAMDMKTGNLEMLSRFYARYPEYADKTFLSVKGAIRDRAPDNSAENIRASVENSQRALGSIKKIDLFQPGRIDRRVPVEDMMQTLAALVKEGKISHIGLSECNADTLRKANAVHPVTAVEIEVSPFSYEENQKKVIATAAELGISVIAYSPLGRGVLAGKIKSSADMEGITVAQLCIAWVAAQGPNVIPLPGSSKSTRTLENLEAGDVVLSAEELKEMNEVIAKHGVKGDRSVGLTDEQMHLWG